jgi:hypothetical protein
LVELESVVKNDNRYYRLSNFLREVEVKTCWADRERELNQGSCIVEASCSKECLY